ncbi:MAG: D-tyrosyl-tRNA(Tyr) deacylase [Candidatus Aminicenantes bacterium]|nr:D-tyrosyl-tRNA(Tyr) deacylase [Candidatus Aminicenantes bacterium]
MRAVIQRVLRARVTVSGQETGRIGPGLLIYVGIERGDSEAEVDYLAAKIPRLRVFANESGRMDLSIMDTGGEILSVSQFTLASRIRKGRRPDFTHAADPVAAEQFYLRFNQQLASTGIPVATGEFGAFMQVESINDGPVTFVVERSGSSCFSEA